MPPVQNRRDFQINGESLVRVKFGAHWTSGLATLSGVPQPSNPGVYELGLALDAVRIIPKYVHSDIFVDDYGPEVPAEVLANIAECQIRMNLVNYNKNVLDVCLSESLGGRPIGISGAYMGMMAGAGIPLGNGRPLGASGCHYISLNILSEQLDFPWRFRASYMPVRPLELPLWPQYSKAAVEFRAIPYVYPPALTVLSGTGGVIIGSGVFQSGTGVAVPGEICSSGAVLWDHTLD